MSANWYSVRDNVAKAPFPAIIEAFRLYREAAESAGQAPLPLQEFARELFPRIAADALRRGRE